jgi:hypothetical protein
MLDITRQAHSRARRARRGFWFPLLLFGAISLLATPLYQLYAPAVGGPTYPVIERTLPWVSFGGYGLRNPLAVTLFWLIALPLGYVATVLYYRIRTNRTGVAGSVQAYVFSGVGLLAALIALSWLGPHPSGVAWGTLPEDILIRGLTPLLTIGIGLLVLAWAERSAPLAIFAVGYLGLALLANLYDLSNLFRIRSPEPALNVIVPGVVLLLAGAAFWVSARRVR